MLHCNIPFNQLNRRPRCYVVITYISSNPRRPWLLCIRCNVRFKQLQDALDATLQHLFEGSNKRLSMIRCNIPFDQHPRRSRCYVLTLVSSNSHKAVDAALWHPLEVTSNTFWMLCCNIHFNQLQRSSGSYVVTSARSHFKDALDDRL